MKELIKKIISIKYCLSYCFYKKKIRGKQNEIIIFNTPNHGNLGDHAILLAEEKLLKDNKLQSFNIPTFRAKYIFNFIKRHTSNKALICITGGGFYSSEWKDEMNLVNKVANEYQTNKIIIFPQTFYFSKEEDAQIFKKNFSKENIYVFARETFSYNLLRNEYSLKNAYLTKDIVLYLKDDMRIEKNSHKEDILLCLRNDVEKDISVEDINILIHELSKEFNISFTDTVLERKIKDKDRENEVLKKIQEFSKYKYVITDRLHGMIFAVLAKVPCFILNNYNYKVKGVYQSIKDDENVFIIDNVNNISKLIKNTKMKLI